MECIEYYAQYYASLASQRDEVGDSISNALRKKCILNYKFSKWQRAVKYKYSLHPLSCVGSMTFIGQRFNYGKELNGILSPFPTLYLAIDRATALQETLTLGTESKSKLSAFDLALMNTQSETIVSVSGELETVFDLRNSRALGAFVKVLNNYEMYI